MRFRLRTLLILTPLLGILLAIGFWLVLGVTHGIDDAYAEWGAADMLIDYMESHDGRWPSNWEALRTNFEETSGRVGGWNLRSIAAAFPSTSKRIPSNCIACLIKLTGRHSTLLARDYKQAYTWGSRRTTRFTSTFDPSENGHELESLSGLQLLPLPCGPRRRGVDWPASCCFLHLGCSCG